MALLTMIFRRMINNKWLVLSLFTGMVLTTALVSTMPVYSEAILSRMLVKELEQVQKDSSKYPGTYYAKVMLADDDDGKRVRTMQSLENYMRGKGAGSFGLPVRELVSEVSTRMMDVSVAGREKPKVQKQTGGIRSIIGLAEHVKLTDGRLPGDQPDSGGAYEVMVTQRTLQKLDFVLGTAITLDDDKHNVHIKLRPVGVFENAREDDLFFRTPGLGDFNNMFVMNDKLFQTELDAGRLSQLSSASWYVVMDYTKMEVSSIAPFLSANKQVQQAIYSKVHPYQTSIEIPAAEIIERYFDRSQQLGRLMWSLNVPVLIMLGFYMYMVSNLTAERQKNEIAVLLSRGAARWQVVAAFAAEALLLSAAALLSGPFLALLLTKMLGASSGFLQFVRRASLPAHVDSAAFGYAAAAAGLCFLMSLLPIIKATRVNIVAHKQQAARRQGKPLWHKAFLDVLLLAISFYGLYTFASRLKNLQELGLASDALQIDPLQFVVPALFILGGGLLLLRLYPLLVRLLYRAGRKWWPPAWYATLIQVGRAGSQYQFLMIFLIITLATGVFSAGAARTINNNMEEQLRYKNGAEFVLTAKWPSDAPVEGAAGPYAEVVAVDRDSIHYTEPPFDPYLQLPGVEHAAKVFVKEEAKFTTEEGTGTAKLMGIDTDDFGNTAWFSPPLLDRPLADYLNLIAPDSRAVLISSTLAEQNQLKPGDSLWISWGDYSSQPFVVYGILPYFPTYNPLPPAGSVQASEDDKEAAPGPMLIVGHLSQIQLQLALEPYQVWLKLKPEAETAAFYKGIEDTDLALTGITNTREQLIRLKNDPFLMAVNGVLTLGFLISVLVTFTGFLLYWILSLKGRTLQSGIMRAMGLSLRQLIGMLALEQVLTSGMAVLIGALTGNIASRLFVPNFQIAFNPGSLVPPFRVILAAGDFARLYVIVGFTLLLGLCILGFMLSRLRIHQALKLGED
ncbi:ABC transporter permease ['Paenibacillus yunnanensis' Narsing Rao et al. 2020]|uniref:ABC transporter permease n=1 Tax=Paenibacillus tengchongensis TaxID=2608684 RepID=UPI00124E3A98|nr:ABC transporter permease [Paenibacillus tengchongensis]